VPYSLFGNNSTNLVKCTFALPQVTHSTGGLEMPGKGTVQIVSPVCLNDDTVGRLATKVDLVLQVLTFSLVGPSVPSD
jgi:hypothetical protein